ncbi:MAG: phosphotransferase [Actinomycetia bacterium]|nr:phosphotransferase [Actinomycetes bacterium]
MVGEPDRSRYALLAARLGGRFVSVTPLTGGVSTPTDLLIYENDDVFTRVVVRGMSALPTKDAGPGSMERMSALLQELRHHRMPVQEPLLTDDGEIMGAPIIVLEYVTGSADHPDPAVAVPEMARLLLRVHALPVGRAGDGGLVDLGLPAAQRPHEEARRLLERLLPAPEVDLLVREPAPPRDPPVLVHGDFWPGNVLWRQGELVGLIDWEDAAIGDPELDLATARVELTLALGPDEAETFRRHYEARSRRGIDQRRVDLWTVCSAAGMLLGVSQWGLSPDHEAHVRRVARQVLDETLERLAHESP